MFNQPIPTITKNLLIINGLFFLATIVFGSRGIDLGNILGAFYPESVNFKGWQIVTHMFMHAPFPNISHILFNMFALWMFGSTVENTIGQKKFLILYFVAGLGSFVLFNFTNYLQVESLKEVVTASGVNVPELIKSLKVSTDGMYNVPTSGDVEKTKELMGYYVTPMVGASGAIYGLLVGFAVLYPNAKLALLFFPVPIAAKYFIPVMIAIEFYLAIQNYAWNPVAHFAHIGGAIIGFLLVRAWKKNLHTGY
ncbi:rhomboid family intramembrane serine protease [Moheibacter sediminis]|uniref:Membrane associated serine protease, rhomboid family n=1 Tax=Moheibacter sediminis TaxID=1434700 RepID=A0A1W1Y6I9_9FLAO|nr:rhomboid family intramembrane serine protease [Moheibacter sediminis]SMC31757.1 Membrane associated serine protease, rhomboid family [Moheibacter sediminis]